MTVAFIGRHNKIIDSHNTLILVCAIKVWTFSILHVDLKAFLFVEETDSKEKLHNQ
jgi:hypothetical protein